jgi:stress response protein YsnF
LVPTTDEAAQMRGRTALDRDGDEIGTVEEVYLDKDTGQPEWLAVKGGLFGGRVSFVPLAEARVEGADVRVPYERAQVRDAPQADADGQLSQDEEARLYRHYGLDYGEERSDSGLPEGGRAPTRDDAITRSEEELRVGVRARETERVRLKKYIVAEPVRETVTTEREEARLEREPITEASGDQARSGPELSEEEHEVTLRAEEPVAEKRVVPKERVRLDKDVVSEQETVSDEVRKEVVEADVPGRERS